MEKNKYCCFFCPSGDYAEKSLEDECPTCGRTYGFVLNNFPSAVGKYRLTKPLGRGFYGAAYIAESEFGRKFVIKVSPVEFYRFFTKKAPFREEILLHVKVAQNADHVVGFIDGEETDVVFSDPDQTTVRCFVTVLDYVDGELLKEYTSGKIQASAATVCQIAIDLLRIREEFSSNQLNHNDLHDGNLIVERLRPELRRANALDDSIKVKAIDLGSISGESKSTNDRYGDLLFIAKHVDALLDRLLSDPASSDDRDYRIALSLQSVIDGFQANAHNIRLPNIDDLIKPVYDAYNTAAHPWKPWRNSLILRGFGDHYNAQTLDSWDVPQLIVYPDTRWLDEITKPGPQIITGMRGCGKTMLLRSLDIHARATAKNDQESSEQILERIRSDKFVGLFVSAQRLLGLRSQSLLKLEYRVSKLFISYALQAARALLHIKDISTSSIKLDSHKRLASCVAAFLDGAEDLVNVNSIENLEQQLTNILVLSSRDVRKYTISVAPTEIFSHLAQQLKVCSDIFESSTLFFLLDDVSTRHLEIEKVGELLSALLFQNSDCAFKFTSEWQTVELGLKSPGREHPIREGRDITVFDLGADVFETLKSRGKKGKKFVAEILYQRSKLHRSHPRKTPAELLGDVSLEQIATEIASTNETSEQKKNAYRGLSCLAKVCVGDIGDVIKLYEEIIRRAPAGTQIPIPADIQSTCFRDLSSRRLYDLNRRENYFKQHAIAFSEVAHDLLVRSYRESLKEGKSKPRLRQYSSIYVRVTSEDEKRVKDQIDRLRELIDASVFVFTGSAARTKTKDSNPIQQFILSYRKIYGLNAFIGLSDRDRFELSGSELEEWLTLPARAKEILLQNQVEEDFEETGDDDEDNDLVISTDSAICTLKPSVQYGLFDSIEEIPPKRDLLRFKAKNINVAIKSLDEHSLAQINVDAVFAGLGFEDRTLASNDFLSKLTKPKRVYAIRYKLNGHSDAIVDSWSKAQIEVDEIIYLSPLVMFPDVDGLAIVDVSGLSKPLIYKTIHRELSKKGRVIVCHAAAQKYYPLQEDLEKLLALNQSEDQAVFLDSLAEVLMGEKGPYSDIRLLDENSDPTRSRALLAFASAKHERLFSLLDRREFDYIEVVTPVEETPRAKVSALAADFIVQNYQNAKVTKIGTDDLFGLVSFLDEQYLDLYSAAGANLEIGLTGSKTQAVAAAILSSQRKIAQAWYLNPKEFDEKRFSTGVGPLRIYDISIPADKPNRP